MVSAFPELLSFGLLAPTILRLVIGFFFAFEALDLLERARATSKLVSEDGVTATPSSPGRGVHVTAYLQFIIGGFLVIGLFTQVAALVALLLCFALLRLAPHPLYAPRERVVYKLLFFIALSLIFLGPGIFAFDLPL